jgi:hypothetical protein
MAVERIEGSLVMKLPFRENAVVPSTKLVDYLLSPTHPVGKTKARFFAAFGFNLANAAEIEQQLIAIAQTEDVQAITTITFGTKYVLGGILQAADGRQALIETVRIIETDTEQPRFVTAYPA